MNFSEKETEKVRREQEHIYNPLSHTMLITSSPFFSQSEDFAEFIKKGLKQALKGFFNTYIKVHRNKIYQMLKNNYDESQL